MKLFTPVLLSVLKLKRAARKCLPMIYHRTIRATCTFGLSLFIFFAEAQTVRRIGKLDPVFQALIEQQHLPPSARSLPTAYRIEPTEGYATRGAQVEKRYHCIVYTKNAKVLRDNGIVINSELPNFVTAWVTLEQMQTMATMAEVQYVEAPRENMHDNDTNLSASGAGLLHAGKLNNTPYKGKGVIVAVYDSGIDWKHADFRDPNDPSKSRILRLWDQTLTATSGEVPPAGFSYGVEYLQEQINDELDGSPTNLVRQRDIDGHGTHVAGIAAGNGSALPSRRYTGMAPEADLIIIKGGDGSFSESRVIDGITYLQQLANTLGRPIVLNMSLGSQFGAHDGTRAYEIAVDNFTASGPGRVAVKSAGNDNGRNLHNRILLSGGANSTVSFNVPNGTAGNDVFQYRIYVNDASDISSQVTVPGTGETLTANAGQSVNSFVLSGNFRIWLVNGIDAANGDRYVDFYLQRNGSNTANPVGTWNLVLTNNTSNSLTLDGWLYYRNTNFSTTTLVGGNSDYLISSPGNSASIITTGSYVGRNNWYSNGASGSYFISTARQDSISTFSSRGPTRDGLLKPEIAANGQVVISCLSTDATYTSSSVAEVGFYATNSGTSMAAPGVAGAVALLLQMKPTATAAEIKTLLTSTANTDNMTTLPGSMPNTTWGYGRLDVFKAASSLFNCTPAVRKSIHYDAGTRNGEESVATLTTTRIAVRFTPDVSGKLANLSFHTSTTRTDLIAELRTNVGGNPGALLASINLPTNNLVTYSWNYVDLTTYNINVTAGTDYFVVVYRNPLSVDNWSLRREAISLDNRSFQSIDGGATWPPVAFDYKIRTNVYSNPQLVGTLAGHNSSDTRNISTSYQFLNNCALIAQVIPNGALPVQGVVNSKVWVESSVPYHAGQPFVSRHYEITPSTNTGAATGRVTLYFTQAEFDAFNIDPGSAINLPANGTDAVGKAALRVIKFPGVSNNGTGLPTSYSGTRTVIDPDDNDIVWNSEQNRWEVSFDNAGFSGFIVQTTVGTLPVRIEYFTGKKLRQTNVLNWKAECSQITDAEFEIQRSNDGVNFNPIGRVAVSAMDCAGEKSYTDVNPLPGKNFYRLRIVENRNIVRFTNVLLLEGDLVQSSFYPTVLPKGGAVQINLAVEKGSLVIYDAIGKQVLTRNLRNGAQNLTLDIRTSGTYHYSIRNEKGEQISSGKIRIE